MTTRILALVFVVACSLGGTAASATNLKPFDPVALRDTVEATAKELMVPGTMVLLRHDGAGRYDAAARRYPF
jgi:hypothetical protein